MQKFSIVFFGSGPVALRSLQLLHTKYTVEAIITKPTTAHEMQSVNPDIPVLTVSNRAELDTLIQEQAFQSPVGVLIDFGIIVSQQVIDSFPRGIINSHFSLLPEWRGADPITFAILSGQHQTGVSLMLLTAGMDEGPLLAQASYAIPSNATTESLTAALIELSDELLRENLERYASGELEPHPQDLETAKPTYSRKLAKADGLIDWNKPAAQLEREIRAFVTWPHSYTTLKGIDIIVLDARVVAETGQPGNIALPNNKQLLVYCSDGALEITRLKPAGKKAMDSSAFIAGYGHRLKA